jgi:hypothetical protein
MARSVAVQCQRLATSQGRFRDFKATALAAQKLPCTQEQTADITWTIWGKGITSAAYYVRTDDQRCVGGVAGS